MALPVGGNLSIYLFSFIFPPRERERERGERWRERERERGKGESSITAKNTFENFHFFLRTNIILIYIKNLSSAF